MPDQQALDSTSRLTPAVTLAMAVAAGAAAANVWYNQPMLGDMARDLGVSEHAVGLVPVATQLGFAAGILLLVPLGDRMDRRTLILWQLAATALALVAAALAPNVPLLVAASALMGAGGATAQQIVPFAAELADPARRGRVVGTVMSGLLSGVLLARVLSGTVAEHYGWRAMYWLGAAIALAIAAALRSVLPHGRPMVQAGYVSLLRSLIELTARFGALRRATLVQGLVFATISGFWSVLALLLEQPRYGLGPTAAGLFGIIGVAGILAAPLAGRISDRRGPDGVIVLGAALAALSFVLFAAWPALPGLVIGVVLVDFGAQASMIGNQTVVYGLAPDARGRVNTVFMTGMFLVGAAGSAGAGLAWAYGGWTAVCLFCFVLAVAAVMAQKLGTGAS